MLHSKKGSSAKSELLSVMEFHGSNIAFEEIDGKMMVNATQMAKPFGQRPKEWLRTQQAKDLIQTVAKRQICPLNDLQVVKHGGENRGTFFQEDVALFFAQWLSPDFYLACNYKLKELLKTQALSIPKRHGVAPIIHDGKLWYCYMDAMRAFGGSTRSSASKRKTRHPEHFNKIFGRNFVTGLYLDILKSYYDWKNGINQLKLSI